jgi:hypothetical protein
MFMPKRHGTVLLDGKQACFIKKGLFSWKCDAPLFIWGDTNTKWGAPLLIWGDANGKWGAPLFIWGDSKTKWGAPHFTSVASPASGAAV